MEHINAIKQYISHAPQGHGSRNLSLIQMHYPSSVMPRRGMGVEMIKYYGTGGGQESCPAGAWE